MRGAKRITVVPAALAAATLAACGEGGPPADLFVVERSGDVPGGGLLLRLTDDGGAHCNGGPRRQLSSAQVLEARELRRALDGEPREEEPGLAQRGLRLPAAADPPSIFSYEVRSEEGTIAFADTSRAGTDVLGRIIKLTRDVARDLCGLPR